MLRIIFLLTLLVAVAHAQTVSSAPPSKGYSAGNSVVVFEGDSLCQTNGSEDGTTTILPFANQFSGRNFTENNQCVAGYTIVNMNNNFSAHVAALYSSQFAKFLVLMLIGGNDIRAGTDAATIYGNMQTAVSSIKELGPNAQAAVATLPLQCDVFNNSAWLAVQQTLNNLIYAGWNVSQADGGLGADYLVDYFANPTIGMNTYSSSAFCNPTYALYPPGQHLLIYGKSIMGPVASPAISAAIPIVVP